MCRLAIAFASYSAVIYHSFDGTGFGSGVCSISSWGVWIDLLTASSYYLFWGSDLKNVVYFTHIRTLRNSWDHSNGRSIRRPRNLRILDFSTALPCSCFFACFFTKTHVCHLQGTWAHPSAIDVSKLKTFFGPLRSETLVQSLGTLLDPTLPTLLDRRKFFQGEGTKRYALGQVYFFLALRLGLAG